MTMKIVVFQLRPPRVLRLLVLVFIKTPERKYSVTSSDADCQHILTTSKLSGCNTYVIGAFTLFSSIKRWPTSGPSTCKHAEDSALLQSNSFSPASTVMRHRLCYGFGL